MKKFTNALVAASLVVSLFTACHQGQTTTMVVRDGNLYQKIEYRGRVVFNEAQTDIESISKGGYLKYETDENEFEAEKGAKGIVYSFNGDSETKVLSADQKQFVAKAIKEITKQRARRNAGK